MAVPECREKWVSPVPDVEEDIEKERMNRILNNKKRMAEIGLVQSREELNKAERWAGHRACLFYATPSCHGPSGQAIRPH